MELNKPDKVFYLRIQHRVFIYKNQMTGEIQIKYLIEEHKIVVSFVQLT